MDIPYRIKRSSVPGKRPKNTDLLFGELGLNTNDGDLYVLKGVSGVGIGSTVTLLTPWTETFGGSSIFYENSVGIGTTTPSEKLHVVGNVKISGELTIGGPLEIGIGISTNTITGPSEIIIDPASVGLNTGSVRIKGDLFVDGTTTTINSTIVEIADAQVGIATTIGTNLLLDGAGIGIGSTNIRKTLTYDFSSDALKSSENFDLESSKVYKINEVEVLSSTTLGAGVTNSNIRNVNSGLIFDREELSASPEDYILYYDVTDGKLKKSTIITAALQGVQGTQGNQGLQGLQGNQGRQGLQGTQGLQGNQGNQGLQGNQGRQGLQGTQGNQGLQGTQGNQGLQGTQGNQGLQGTQGNQGLQGTQGNQGLQGTQGNQGLQGLSNQGVQGNQGLQGLQGLQGNQGLQGLQGLSHQGVQGLQGLQGTQGTQGTQGAIGPTASVPDQSVILDDISSQFNGSATQFTISSSSVNFINSEIDGAARLLISVGGVVQQPDPTQNAGFYISGGTDRTTDPIKINFAEAPRTGMAFFGVAIKSTNSPNVAYAAYGEPITYAVIFGV